MSFFSELKRRNVFRMGIAYLVLGWLVLQVTDVVVPILELPEWVAKLVLFLLLIGFPLVLFFAWAFELTPEGVKRERDVDRSRSITTQTGKKLDRAIIGILVVAVAVLLFDRFRVEAPAPGVIEPDIAAVDRHAEQTQSPAAAGKSVAVLPFVAMSSGPDDEYFADGLTEEILNSLAQLPELLVTARTSAFSFKGKDLPVAEIATALGVRHIVEGSVRRSGDRMRVTAQLVRADDGFHLWSETYDSKEQDTIAVQEDIAEKIARAMDVVLDERKLDMMRQAGLRDVEAFTLYQKGLELYALAHGEREQIGALREANAYFERVLELVPGIAQVYMDHSDLYVHILNNTVTDQEMVGVSEEDWRNAHANALRDMQAAVRFARTPRERHSFELDLAYLSGNWRGLTGRIELALAEPGCIDGNWTAPVANLFGYARRYAQRTIEIRACDPLWSVAWFNAIRAALWSGDPVTALEIAREASTVVPGSWNNMAFIRSLVANGLFEEARELVRDRVQLDSDALVTEATILAAEGDREGFEAKLTEYLEHENSSTFWKTILLAQGGRREDVNANAAQMDAYPNSEAPMLLVAYWCACGAPWDLEATPGFAAKLAEGNLPWPPISPIEFPLKDW